MAVDRRRFLQGGVASAALLGVGQVGCAGHPGAAPVEPGTSPFRHGVASGDPLADRVILWSRISPERDRLGEPIAVDWWVALDPAGRHRVSEGRVEAEPGRDYTVKIDVDGLEPDTRYHYRFAARGFPSPVGRTRTLPDGPTDRIRMAFVSCSNFPRGYFNAYGCIAERDDIELVLHLGDYLYEYGNEGYGDGTSLGRISDPLHEVIGLEDYRRRHACYKSDADLQSVHARHPFIAIWDDHESANNAWKDGAENHQPDAGEGRWTLRRQAAVRAYYEWMPIRELPTGLFRSFRLGDLIDLLMLDTRLAGRDRQVERDDHERARDPQRSLLGAEQERWLLDALSESKRAGTSWRVLGQQVVFAPLALGETFNPDAWDGYRESRRRLLQRLDEEAIDDVVFLTGDVHSAWAFDIPASEAAGADSVAVEFVTPAVSSPPLGASPSLAERLRDVGEQTPHLRYMNLVDNGYSILDVTHDRARAQWFFVETTTHRTRAQRCGPAFETRRGANRLEESRLPACDL